MRVTQIFATTQIDVAHGLGECSIHNVGLLGGIQRTALGLLFFLVHSAELVQQGSQLLAPVRENSNHNGCVETANVLRERKKYREV